MILRNIFTSAFNNLRRINTNPKGKETNYARKIFSGIQPTGSVHLGNYLGALRQWIKLQDNNEDVILCIVDLHAITMPHVPEELSNNIVEMTATLLACGLDPNKLTLYQQSQVPQHAELCWYLSCISTMARLAHLPQFKEKSSTLKDVPLGLFTYPVLQAADILLYKATHVPVGEDQLQHLQLAQELARMFNNRFGETFPIPHAITEVGTAKIKNLRNPTKKMSKSDADEKSRILLTDSDDEIVKKVRKAVTDLTSNITYDPEKRPGVSNLIAIHSVLADKPIAEICTESQRLDTGKYKSLVAETIVNHVAPIRERIVRYLNDKQYVLDVLSNGSERVSVVADDTMQEVRHKLGVRPSYCDSESVRVAKKK